jgi:predicted MPP superfamily phosphohydrolase
MSTLVRLALFLPVVLFVVACLGVHLQRRVRDTLGMPRLGRALFLSIALAVLCSALSRAGLLGRADAVLGAVGGLIVLGAFISSVLLWPYELGRFALTLPRLLRAIGARFRKRAEETPGATPLRAEPGRRGFLGQVTVGGALSLGFGSASYGGLFGRHDYQLDEVPLVLSKLPRALDGFSIVQLSDLHVGTYVGEREFRSGLELVRRARPDIIVLTGDLVDFDPSYASQLGRFVQGLRGIARHGVYAIPGNHDYYTGVDAVLNTLRETGAEVLLNRHVRIGDGSASFVLGGCDDVLAPRYGGVGPDPEATFRAAPDELARVLLSHNPETYRYLHRHADLVLSGHTHGGQITLFINPAELVLTHGYVRGHYQHGESQLYVNRGFGTAGPPARVGSPPEITRLILTARA